MPHIRALFPENPDIRSFLKENRFPLRTIIAEEFGYPNREVALIPDPVSPENLELAGNLSPLEFVVDSGSHALGREGECAEKIRGRIVEECPGADAINFLVWIKSNGNTGFVEHKPKL